MPPGRVSRVPTRPASPLAWLVKDERQKLVQQALGGCPPRDAELLVLKYAEGFSARELAERWASPSRRSRPGCTAPADDSAPSWPHSPTDFEESDHD